MTSSHGRLEFFARFLICVALMLSMIGGETLWNRITIRQHRDGYFPSTFTVMDAQFESDGDGTIDYWLDGTIADGKRTYLHEKYFPNLSAKAQPGSVADLLRSYPKGSKINVMYNPEVSDLVQRNGEALRVIQAGPAFWNEESVRFRNALIFTFAPLAFAVVLFIVIRRTNRS